MRCYNGCPDNTLRMLLADSAKADEELAAIGARAVYFPMECGWMVFKDYLPISEFYDTKRGAATSVLNAREKSL